jgi:hypothetical protein
MKQVMKSLETKVEQMKSLEAKVEQLKGLESTTIELQAKVTVLEAKVEQQDSLLTSLLREKNDLSAAATDYVPINNNQSAVAINGLPSSCGDLKMIGHTLNGFYSVIGSTMMESVYCDFTKLPDDAGKFHKFSRIIQFNSLINEKVSRNGLDMSTSNQRPSISTSREILHLTQLELQFRLNWLG